MPPEPFNRNSLLWGLYENHPGEHGKLVGVFSAIDLAKNCALIQPLLISKWEPRDLGSSYLWVARALDPEQYGEEIFSFTVEEIQVDRLVETTGSISASD
jgi:hypothetical protein